MAEESFEEALKKLEDIVKKLEEGGLSLEDALKSFEEGIRLSRICHRILDETERKMEILIKDQEGRVRREQFQLEEEQ